MPSEARQVDASNGKLVSEVAGEVELEGKVLVLRRIHVLHKLRAPEDMREVVERVHAVHADFCPVARSIKGAIEVHRTFELVS